MELDEATAQIEPIILMNNPVAGSPEDQIPLNVTVVYQDAHTRDWANQTCARVAHGVHTDPIRSSWWKLDCLGLPLLLVGAVKAAADADVIIVALRATETIPFELTHWLEAWLEQREGREGAFVALIGGSEATEAGALSTRAYLQAVARRGHLQFISQVKPVASTFYSRVRDPVIIPFQAPQPLDAGVFGRSGDFHDNWGINE